ncbi:hypothetical protein [Polaribacter ponticola]|uniref:Uncharacterized protein n=1 Tax=Polaribacter ponticola TaxID=2978475 RepID=A0ABT5S6P4_9FLAO|nr:hypothetical protein [Polaribacter sp. MSW5]MDD7913767.1 hypothetical protein [Polaribacter sp. MSW5]
MEKIISITSNIFTIFASGIAIYLFLFQRDKISNAINLLLNYSTQLTLSELKSKLERLNSYNANAKAQNEEVINILHEIEGQIKGNKLLKSNLENTMNTISKYIENPIKLTEPRKRSLVHELRESIRNLDMNSFNKLVNKNQK